MKFGVVVYKDSKNIGDDIQSYAAAHLLPRVDYFIDRENLDLFRPHEEEPVNVIINGWLMYNKLAWPVSPCINPLYISMHFWENDALGINGQFLSGIGGDDLRAAAPVGCRDLSTLRFLKENGIDGYYSGCLTLTLNPIGPVKRASYVCLTDVSDKVESFYRSQYPDLEFKVIKHVSDGIVEQNASWEKRFSNVEKLLTVYQNAQAVVTTRLHCAMPNLALETPVLLVLQDSIEERNRFEGLENLVHHTSEADILSGKSDFDLRLPSKNPAEYKKLRAKLKTAVTEFVRTNQECTPKLKERYRLYDLEMEKRVAWKNEQLYQLQKKAVLYSQRNHQAMEELQAGKDWLERQYDTQKELIRQMQTSEKAMKQWLEELQSGKKWLENKTVELEQNLLRKTEQATELGQQLAATEKRVTEAERVITEQSKQLSELTARLEAIPEPLRKAFYTLDTLKAGKEK